MEPAAPPNPAIRPHRRSRRLKPFDVIFIVVVVALCVVLLRILLGQLSLRNEVSGAKVITNRVASDIRKVDATDVYKLAGSKFQADHSTAQLQSLFKSVNQYATGTPVIVKQTVANSNASDNVAIIYKYAPSKPYYIRITVSKPKNVSTWQLVGLSGNDSEAALLTN